MRGRRLIVAGAAIVIAAAVVAAATYVIRDEPATYEATATIATRPGNGIGANSQRARQYELLGALEPAEVGALAGLDILEHEVELGTGGVLIDLTVKSSTEAGAVTAVNELAEWVRAEGRAAYVREQERDVELIAEEIERVTSELETLEGSDRDWAQSRLNGLENELEGAQLAAERVDHVIEILSPAESATPTTQPGRDAAIAFGLTLVTGAVALTVARSARE